MSLSAALNSAVTSIKANQEALSLLSQNITNAESEGYSRQSISYRAATVAGRSAGVAVDAIERATDKFLIEEARKQVADYSYAEVKLDYFERVELLLGDPGEENSLSAYMTDFFDQLSQLAISPDQSVLRATTLQSADDLAGEISSLALGLHSLQFDIDKDIASAVSALNQDLQELNAINVSIREMFIAGQNTNSLLDQRDELLSSISSVVETNVSFDQYGTATVYLAGATLVDDIDYYQLDYTRAVSTDSFVAGAALDSIDIYAVDSDGGINTARPSVTIVTGSSEGTPAASFTSGELYGLLELRDFEIPRMLDQLDNLAQSLQDSFNAIHNNGVGYPPAEDLTGTNLVDPDHVFSMSGEWMVAALNNEGQAIADPYDSSGESAINPLVLNFDRMTQDGVTYGRVTVEDIMNEINSYYTPHNKATVGPLDDIQLRGVTDTLSVTPASATFTFATNPAVNDTITIDDGVNPAVVYTFTNSSPAGSGQITIQSTAVETAVEVARVLNSRVSDVTLNQATYSASAGVVTATMGVAGSGGNNALTLSSGGAGSPPVASGATAGGVDSSGTFIFDIEAMNIGSLDNVSLTIGDLNNVSFNPAAGVSIDVAQSTFTDLSVQPGDRDRSGSSGLSNMIYLDVDVAAGLQEGDTFTMSVPVTVTEVDDTVSPIQTNIYNEIITYTFTVPSPGESLNNVRLTPISTQGAGTFTPNFTNDRYIRASLVNENGVQVADGEPGYLQLNASRSNGTIGISEMNSSENGNLTNGAAATNRGLSHFFGLNDFFESGDGVSGSAVSLAVREEYLNDTSLMSLGALALDAQPTESNAAPVYTYGVSVGSDATIGLLADLQNTSIAFSAAGGLTSSTTTLTGYTSELLGYAVSRGNIMISRFGQEERLTETFSNQKDSISGVNIDEELANTVVLQNNYQATAQVIATVSELFEVLIGAFN